MYTAEAIVIFFFSSRRRHTRCSRDWSSDVCSSDLIQTACIQRFPTVLNQVLDIELLRVRWPACKLWRIEPLFSDREEPSEVEVVSGACLMIRRDVFETVGLFSEDYFMYAEDVDLCFKIHKK